VGNGTGLRLRWYNDLAQTQWVDEELDPVLSHAWPAVPHAGVGADGYSAVWRGYIVPLYTETYALRLTFREGGRIWIDGRLLASKWIGDAAHPNWDNSIQTQTVLISLQAGNLHPIRIDIADTKGEGLMKLTWSSLSQIEQIIPATQLIPDPASDPDLLTIETPLRSRTSPAWIEGRSGGNGVALQATAGGNALQVLRTAAGSWFLANATGDLPPGLPLDARGSTLLRLVTDIPNRPVREVLAHVRWDVTDLTALPYGLDSLLLRRGESLLLAASGNATLKIIDENEVALATWLQTGEPSPRAFATPGTFALVAERAGVEIARLAVNVIGVDWDGPIACHLGYRRGKNVTVLGSSEHAVTFSAVDAERLMVDVMTPDAKAPRLGIKPLFPGAQWMLARQGNVGPVLSVVQVDGFTLHSTASRHIPLTSLSNGTLLGQAEAILMPWTADIECRIRMFTSGVTLLDGSTLGIFPSVDFTVEDDGSGRLPFGLLRPNQTNNKYCHAVEAFQRGERISP